ncbi:hypothetical protein AB1Y20_015026 [Prymnesium parvum]|uniref:RRM domain-containing protein n=1 Tax=Prymnesium parvum TaxID=97485 RepID=A0AB34JX81_PRYPA
MGLLVDDSTLTPSPAAALFASAVSVAAPHKIDKARTSKRASSDKPPTERRTKSPAKAHSADHILEEEQELPAVPGDQKRVGEAPKRRKRVPSAEEDSARLACTIFVGNVPVDVQRPTLAKHFSSYGAVETVRIRSVAAANPKMPQKAAVIKKDIDSSVKASVNAYIVFKAPESASAATAANGSLAFGRHLRVDLAGAIGSSATSSAPEGGRCVFLGNLAFDTQEEALWQHFETCGKIEYVRIIREPRTQMGKGFGYVSFVDSGSVEAALALHGTKFADRELRVFRYSGAKGKTSSAAATSKARPAQDTAAAAEKGSGPGPGWQQRERRRQLQKRQRKPTSKGKPGGPSTPKFKDSAISKQRKLLKARKQAKVERKIKKRGGIVVKKSKKGSAQQKKRKEK